MSKPSLLMISPFPPADMTAMEASYDVHKLWEAKDKAAFIKQYGPDIRAIATAGTADKKLIDQLPKLEIIASFGVGVDGIDLDEAKKRKVAVTNTPDVVTSDVADLALGLMIALARDIPQADQFMRQGKWKNETLPLATKFADKRLGIIGLGHIGKAIAKRALAFDMKISYNTPHKDNDVPFTYYDNLEDLAKNSDFLIITVPGGPSTAKMIDQKVLSALGKDGFFINVARGSVVNEPDLIAALKNKTIKGAALDVFWNEPDVNPEFFKLENTVLGPHRGTATVETRKIMGQLVRDNLTAHFSGKPLLTPVE